MYRPLCDLRRLLDTDCADGTALWVSAAGEDVDDALEMTGTSETGRGVILSSCISIGFGIRGRAPSGIAAALFSDGVGSAVTDSVTLSGADRFGRRRGVTGRAFCSTSGKAGLVQRFDVVDFARPARTSSALLEGIVVGSSPSPLNAASGSVSFVAMRLTLPPTVIRNVIA
jgi:hypothetical protein